MTTFKTKIDTSKSTESEALVTDVNVTEGGKSNPLVQISVPNMYMKFSTKALSILRALANKKRFFYSYNIAVLNPKERSDENIIIHVVKNKDGCTELFEPLRRLGIVLSELKIGISSDYQKVYLTGKTLKDLSKFPDDTKQEVVMYLISICHLFNGIVLENPTLSCIYGSGLETNITIWENYIYSFVDGAEVSVQEIPIEDLKCIRYHNTFYSTPSKIVAGYADSGYVVSETLGVRNLVLKRDFDTTVFWVYSPMKNCVFTNDNLTYMNLDYDTFSAGFTHALGSTIDVIYKKDLGKLYDSSKVHNVSTEIEDSMYESDKLFQKIVTNFKSQAGIVKSSLTRLIATPTITTGLVDKESMVEQYKDDPYAQQLYTQAQDYYDTFDLKSLNHSVRGFSNGDVYAMMFVGEAGTGKSTAARVIPYRCGIPYVSINFCVNIEESDLIGTMIPNPEKNTADDPEFIWQDGIITKAVRNGYAVLLEEINFARPGVLGKLNSLLDENRQIDLPNGEILKAHKNFRMIATCNIAYEGTNRFNKALINRFEIVHEFKDLEKTEAFKAIKERVKGVDDAKLSAVYTVYELLKKYSKEQSIDIVVSIRQLFNVFRQGKYYTNAYDAVIDTMVNGAFVELPEYKDKFVETLSTSALKGKLTFKI